MKKVSIILAVAALTLALSSRHAQVVFGSQGGRLPILITQPIDETRLVTLVGNTRPEASAAYDRGRVADDFPVQHMLLQLRRAPELEREFEQYIETLTDKSSPNFRNWMMASEQGEKYGLAQADLDTITGWLKSHGFEVGYVYPNGMVIDFSGTAGNIREAFHTDIHALNVNGKDHFANWSDPKIPAALAPAIVGVASIHNFRPHAMNIRKPNYTFGCTGVPFSSTCYALVPADYQTIYNLNPLYTAGITGKGQTVVVIEDTNTFANDWSNYQKTFGLTTYGGTLTTVHPDDAGNCTNPGTNGDDIEADLDAEMVTAFAPGATVEVASCASGTPLASFGGLIALENLVSAGSPPPVISMSYGVCEVLSGASLNASFNSAFQSAAAAGVSVFVSSGDDGSSSCARDFLPGGSYALPGIGVTGWGESVYNVSVGGTDFEDVYNALEGGLPVTTYWNTTNGTTFGSAKSYIPEIPWDDSCASFMIYNAEKFTVPYGTNGFCNSTTGASFLSTAAASGGPSNCAKGSGNPKYAYVEDTSCTGYPKPSWQNGILGNPRDGVRDIPDVSLFAANGIWGHYVVICASDPGSGGVPCTGAPDTWTGVGGTSASSPAMAAIQALVDQKHAIRAGNPNPTYYSIAKTEFGSQGNSSCYSINQTGGTTTCTFYDITQGDIDVNCRPNGTVFKADCYVPSSTNGTTGTQPIGSLTLTSGGSGYTSTPTCTISGPTNQNKYLSPTGKVLYGGGGLATCTATINPTTGVVTAVTLTRPGLGYTGVPQCVISCGGGKGARCMAVITPATPAPSYQPAFGATPGWDLATGLGSVNATNLVNNAAW
jgi:subtilase family serine protease